MFPIAPGTICADLRLRNIFKNMDENNETIPTWKIFTWLGIGFFAVIVIWCIIDTCYDIQKSETEEEKVANLRRCSRSSNSKPEPRNTCNTPLIKK